MRKIPTLFVRDPNNRARWTSGGRFVRWRVLAADHGPITETDT